MTAQVERDLARKMVFVGGPRQVGKTTLARQLLAGRSGHLSWDISEDRERILRRELPAGGLVFDELHKYRRWRNYLKGLYDRGEGPRILVTGSARLDVYRFGGDALQGRYHYLRLHPLSVAELGMKTPAELEQLLRFENLVASHLLKWVHHQQDTAGRDLELRYFRDVDRRDGIRVANAMVLLRGLV